MQNGDWIWYNTTKETAQIIEQNELWGEQTLKVWLPAKDAVINISVKEASPISGSNYLSSQDALAYITAAARISETLNQDVLLAPIGASVIPLPHQVHALSRAMSGDRVRYLLADEVGLGKTIEAGLIIRELKLRGLVKRVLVVAPTGIALQWVSEMANHFEEHFSLIQASELDNLSQKAGLKNPWLAHDQVITTLDGIKPLEKRRGWSLEKIAAYNQKRFEDLIAAGWDLIIVDEAHRIGGSTEQVARYQLGRGLSEAAPYFLLLSATPHQGKSDAFHRLMALIDPLAFPDENSVSQDKVRPYVIRTEKRNAINGEGEPLFKPRQTRLIQVSWGAKHEKQKALYEAVTEYATKGYNQAMKKKDQAAGFLMVLMQRLVSSSSAAITNTLERRLAILNGEEDTREAQTTSFDLFSFLEMDGEAQLEAVMDIAAKENAKEIQQVETMLKMAKEAVREGNDPKAESLLKLMTQLEQKEGNSELKFLIFTEFIPTQMMLEKYLTNRGYSVVCLNGSLSIHERKAAQESFAGDKRVFISTDAGGEGLNLQFCHIIINYDMPWNPMRVEQRIGRVDRIGQSHPVQALNLVLEDTVESRVREVLEEKLAIILKEFGVDKTSDVLDSAEAESIFDELYKKAYKDPKKIESAVNSAMNSVKERAEAYSTGAGLLGSEGVMDSSQIQTIKDHPLFHWIERMVCTYCKHQGGKAEQNQILSRSWDITWPDGHTDNRIVFTPQDAEDDPVAKQLTLEDPKVRGLTQRIPTSSPGQPVPVVLVADLPSDIVGYWGLWRINLKTETENHYKIIPIFVREDGKIFQPTARRLWDLLIAGDWVSGEPIKGIEAESIYNKLHECAKEQGGGEYRALKADYEKRLAKNKEKTNHAFNSRRKAIERIGLEQVKQHRLRQLNVEIEEKDLQFKREENIHPTLEALVIIKVEGVN